MEKAEIEMEVAIRDEQVLVEESPPGSVEEQLFIPFRSPSLDPNRYAEVGDTLPASDAAESQDEEYDGGGDVRHGVRR
jgi:hypothetical protein